MRAPFGAVLTAVITPFTSGGELDMEAVDRLIAHLCPLHTDGVVVGGTTGEGPTLARDEKLRLFEHYKKYVPEGTTVVANTGTNNTAESISMTEEARKIGVDGVMAVMPYYNKPNFDGQIAHFTAIADVGLPVLLYNIPGRSGAIILPDAVSKLSRHPNIVAIKEAAGDVEMVDWYGENCAKDFAVYSGDDPLTLEMMKRGAVGVVSVASHLVGDEIKKMIEAAECGDLSAAEAIQGKYLPIFSGLFSTTNPIPVKTACTMLGLCEAEFRLPMTKMRQDPKAKLRELLVEFALVQSACEQMN